MVEHKQIPGEAVLVQFEHILVPCRIVHGPTRSHLDRLCVEPLQGVGRTWVDAGRIGASWEEDK